MATCNLARWLMHLCEKVSIYEENTLPQIKSYSAKNSETVVVCKICEFGNVSNLGYNNVVALGEITSSLLLATCLS